MESSNIWEILGIEQTKDEKEIKDAYRKQLLNTNPEDNQKGFMELRKAYELAIEYSKKDEEKESNQKDEIDFFIDKVKDLYNDFWKRHDIECWKEILQDDLCISLDTSNDVCERLLVFLMENYNLDHSIFLLLDKVFGIRQMKSSLYNKFPKSYIDFIINRIKEKQDFSFDLFEKNDEYLTKDYDEYYAKYREYRAVYFEEDDENKQKKDELLDELIKCKAKHPYTDIELINKKIDEGKFDEVVPILDKVCKDEYMKDIFILSSIGIAKFKIGNKADGLMYLNKARELYPDNQTIICYIIDCKEELEEYMEVFDMCFEFREKYGENEIIDIHSKKASKHIIEELKKSVIEEGNIKNLHKTLICFGELEKYNECIQWLNNNNIEKMDEIYYYEYTGRCYFELEKYNEATSNFSKAVECIDNAKKTMPEHFSEEEKNDKESLYNKIKRKSYIEYMIASCYIAGSKNCKDEITRKDVVYKAVSYLTHAIETEKDEELKLYYKERIAFCKIELGDYENAIRELSEIIRNEEKNMEIALFDRMRAYFKLKNPSGVLNDAMQIIKQFPKFALTYVYCIYVYQTMDEYEEAESVFDTVRQVGLKDDIFTYLYARQVLYTSSDAKKEEALENLLQLIKDNTLKEEEYKDIFDIHLEYIVAKLYHHLGKYTQANEYLLLAIEKKGELQFYLDFKAELLYCTQEYEESNKVIKYLINKYTDDVKYRYEMAWNYRKLNQNDEAINMLNKGIQLDDDDVFCRRTLVDIYLERYDSMYERTSYAKARSIQEEIIKKNARIGDYDKLYRIYIRKCDYNNAYNCLEKIKELYGESIYVFELFGDVYRYQRQYEKASKYYIKAKNLIDNENDINNCDSIYLSLAKTNVALNRYQDAISVLDERVKKADSKVEILLEKIRVHIKAKQYDEAVTICDNLLYELPKERLEDIENVVDLYLKVLYMAKRIDDSKRIVDRFVMTCDNVNTNDAIYKKYMMVYKYGCLTNASDENKRKILEKAYNLIPNDMGSAIECYVGLLKCCYKMKDNDRISVVYGELNYNIKQQYGYVENYIKFYDASKANATSIGLCAFYASDYERCKQCLGIAQNTTMCLGCDKEKCELLVRLEAEIYRMNGEYARSFDMFQEAFLITDYYYPDIVDDLFELNEFLKNQCY